MSKREQIKEDDGWKEIKESEIQRRLADGESDIFPWNDVEACMDKLIDVRSNCIPCPICGKPSEDLLWIHFRSPLWTWKRLCGCEGALSICPDCHWQIEFLCESMN